MSRRRVNAAAALVACLACLAALVGACDRSPTAASPIVQGSEPAASPSLTGRVFEILPGSRVPAVGVNVLVNVMSVFGCSAPCIRHVSWSYQNRTTGPDGRYSVDQLPSGSAAVTVNVYSSGHRQVCAAGTDVNGATRLDVEITANENPQPSATMPPLRVTGQVYEMTPNGRVGVGGANIGLEDHGPDSPFHQVVADADGRFTICGIPEDWPIALQAGKAGYVGEYTWHQFNTDTTLDIELKRR